MVLYLQGSTIKCFSKNYKPPDKLFCMSSNNARYIAAGAVATLAAYVAITLKKRHDEKFGFHFPRNDDKGESQDEGSASESSMESRKTEEDPSLKFEEAKEDDETDEGEANESAAGTTEKSPSSSSESEQDEKSGGDEASDSSPAQEAESTNPSLGDGEEGSSKGDAGTTPTDTAGETDSDGGGCPEDHFTREHLPCSEFLSSSSTEAEEAVAAPGDLDAQGNDGSECTEEHFEYVHIPCSEISSSSPSASEGPKSGSQLSSSSLSADGGNGEFSQLHVSCPDSHYESVHRECSVLANTSVSKDVSTCPAGSLKDMLTNMFEK